MKQLNLKLGENAKNVLLDIAKRLNNQYRFPDNYVKHKGQSLFELNIETLDITKICTLEDIQNGKIHPIRNNNCLYLFKLNEENAVKAFTNVIYRICNHTKKD